MGQIYFDCTDDEIKTETDPDEAIHQYLEVFDSITEFPEEVTAKAWVPIDVTEAEKVAWCVRIIEWLHEEADQDHGHHEFETLDEKQIEKLHGNARQFVDAFFAEYRSSALERAPQHDVTVNVHDWVRKNEPDWLEGE